MVKLGLGHKAGERLVIRGALAGQAHDERGAQGKIGDALLEAPHQLPGARLAVPTLHHASVVQGRTCLRLFGALHPDVPCEDLRAWFAAHDLPPHLVLVLGLTLGRAQYSLPAAATLFLYTTVRDQLSADIRLGLLGPTDAHTLLANLYPAMASARAAAAARPWRAATRHYPLLELAQASHPYVYAKLFQS